MFSTAISDSRPLGGAAAIAEHMQALSGMVIPEPAEHGVGGLGTEGEHSLAELEGRSHWRQSKPHRSRSRIPQPTGGDDDPLSREAKWPGQDRVHSAIGLMRQNIVGCSASCTFRRRGAMQKEFKARAVDRGEIVLELGKSDTAPRSVRSAVSHCETRHAPATNLAVIDMRKAGPTRSSSRVRIIAAAPS